MIDIPLKYIWSFEYNGKIQSITLGPGKYQLECFGAKGYNGTNGNYVKAILRLKEFATLYITCGEMPANANGGWNGGGNGSNGGGGGGGKTDISVFGINDSTQWDEESHNNTIILSAAGGRGYHYVKTTSYTHKWYHNSPGCIYSYKTHSWTSSSSSRPSRCAHCGHDCGTYKGYTANHSIGQGGNGGGVDYFYSQSTQNSYPYGICQISNKFYVEKIIQSTAINNSNGKVIITKIPINIYYTDCIGDCDETYGDTIINFYTHQYKKIDSNIQEFSLYIINPNDYQTKLYKNLKDSIYIPLDTCDDIYIIAKYINLKKRVNSNYYRDSYHQEHFDFNKLIGGD